MGTKKHEPRECKPSQDAYLTTDGSAMHSPPPQTNSSNMEENTFQAVATKRCSTCGKELPLSAFAKNKSSKDGLQHACRACHAEYDRNRLYGHKKRLEVTSTPVTPPPAPAETPLMFKAAQTNIDALVELEEELRQREEALNAREAAIKAKEMTLKAEVTLTNRQLLAELKARGYVWKPGGLKYIQDIDFDKI